MTAADAAAKPKTSSRATRKREIMLMRKLRAILQQGPEVRTDHLLMKAITKIDDARKTLPKPVIKEPPRPMAPTRESQGNILAEAKAALAAAAAASSAAVAASAKAGFPSLAARSRDKRARWRQPLPISREALYARAISSAAVVEKLKQNDWRRQEEAAQAYSAVEAILSMRAAQAGDGDPAAPMANADGEQDGSSSSSDDEEEEEMQGMESEDTLGDALSRAVTMARESFTEGRKTAPTPVASDHEMTSYCPSAIVTPRDPSPPYD